MPVDKQGVKWACEACIRGHRSLKCQHFDRIMKKVRRPGRPLTKGQCMKQPCDCYEQLVFLPRNSFDPNQAQSTNTINHYVAPEIQNLPQARPRSVSRSSGGCVMKAQEKPNPLNISFLINPVKECAASRLEDQEGFKDSPDSVPPASETLWNSHWQL